MIEIIGLCVCIVLTLTCLLGLCLFVVFEACPDIVIFLKRLRYRFSKNPVKGYKGFHSDMTCNGMQYRQNEEFILAEEPALCHQGFHFCSRLSDVFDYYNEDTDMYCPVTAFGVVKGPHHSDKQCTDAIRIGKRLTPPEIYAILLQENPTLPKDHQLIELVYSGMTERGYFHRRLNLILKWLKRAENYTARLNGGRKVRVDGKEAKKGVVRIKGRLRRR